MMINVNPGKAGWLQPGGRLLASDRRLRFPLQQRSSRTHLRALRHTLAGETHFHFLQHTFPFTRFLEEETLSCEQQYCWFLIFPWWWNTSAIISRVMLIALGLTPVSPRLGGTRIPDPSAGLADPQTSLKDPPPSPIRGHQSQSQPKLHRWPSQAYHTAHLEAIKGFGMHGYEIDFEVLVQEYQVGQQMNIILKMKGAKILTRAPVWGLSCMYLMISGAIAIVLWYLM